MSTNKIKPKGYWTEECLMELAKDYSSITDFKKFHPSAYKIACARDWIDSVHQKIEEKYPLLTEEDCRLEAAKYNNKEDFKNKSPLHYMWAKRHRRLTEITRHMNNRGSRRHVYVFEFEDNYAYIGLSLYPIKRSRQHLNELRSVVYKHIKETGAKYIFKVLTEYPSEEPMQEEIIWNEKYKHEGWILLNKQCDVKTEGNMRPSDKNSIETKHWTKEQCQEAANKYKTRKDFQKECRGAYAAAYRNKWLNDICSHMKRPSPQKTYWTKERCKEEAARYSTRMDFRKQSSNAYNTARKLGILDEICSHMTAPTKPVGYWTKERCIKEAKKWGNLSSFRKNNTSAYMIAWRNGWLQELNDAL